VGFAVYQLSQNGLPLAPTQADLTPLQREVMLTAIAKEAEEKEKQMDKAKNGGGGGGGGGGVPQQNSKANGGTKTVESRTFVNTGPDGRDDFD
jgi:hypothetical protein